MREAEREGRRRAENLAMREAEREDRLRAENLAMREEAEREASGHRRAEEGSAAEGGEKRRAADRAQKKGAKHAPAKAAGVDRRFVQKEVMISVGGMNMRL
eukprot:CAMPEP_0168485972 /NCGR_PEP_ID=MMETSP0228-20121227/66884_1 /TAXON_ID=133427 /ORGANISM="Protoceratium reticulatum, Strain CCCM 535 (=CCMP 1889)" /LENGTH=100 /DNA_ID=CAMNT_0008502551 /DNA_START=42 /DNA_END=344 /DNA_ORIENTATION=+